MAHLHVDIETFSSVDIKTSGAYKYAESDDFEILMVAYAVDDEPVCCFDWDDLPESFFQMLTDPNVVKIAHNAAFERVCFRAVGYDIPVHHWRCSAVKAAYCGLPMKLGDLTKVLNLGDKGKLTSGSALIRYFCIPCRPTLSNGQRTRNRKEDNPEKWANFKMYCVNDVEAEREILKRLSFISMPYEEWQAYFLDQQINDRGVKLDLQMVDSAIEADETNTDKLNYRLKQLTGLDNPNSLSQLRGWITRTSGQEVTSLAKDAASQIKSETSDGRVREVLTIREQTGKTSIKKYTAMRACAGKDERARGLFQFYGAGRTGRWAGRLIQLQNLPRNYMKDLSEARSLLKRSPTGSFPLVYDVSDTLSQLIRTALIPSEGHIFGVADFSAIEARVLSWLADERWRLEVFSTHGKIYEASASRMFGVPMDQIGKGSELRQRGKVAELALGYQGGVGALTAMGADKMGLSEEDMKVIVSKWRVANQRICEFWQSIEDAAVKTLDTGLRVKHPSGIEFSKAQNCMLLKLPSGRNLVYWDAELTQRNRRRSIRYRGVDGVTKQWIWVDTYGGKLTENIVQAVSRDLLLHSLRVLSHGGYRIVMHVHDEVVCEIESDLDTKAELDNILQYMGVVPEWAAGFPLTADGYLCTFYMKD